MSSSEYHNASVLVGTSVSYSETNGQKSFGFIQDDINGLRTTEPWTPSIRWMCEKCERSPCQPRAWRTPVLSGTERWSLLAVEVRKAERQRSRNAGFLVQVREKFQLIDFGM